MKIALWQGLLSIAAVAAVAGVGIYVIPSLQGSDPVIASPTTSITETDPVVNTDTPLPLAEFTETSTPTPTITPSSTATPTITTTRRPTSTPTATQEPQIIVPPATTPIPTGAGRDPNRPGPTAVDTPSHS